MPGQVEKETSERFQQSYGIWIEMSEMLLPSEFLQLQILNRYAYRVSISRAQLRFKVRLRPLCALAFPDDCDLHTQLLVLEGQANKQRWTEKDLFPKDCQIAKIMIKMSLFTILKQNHPQFVFKSDILKGSSNIFQNRVSQLPLKVLVKGFALTAVHNRHIMLTGGFNSSNIKSIPHQTLLFDTVTEEWTKLPKLNKMRAFHISCASNSSAFVYGGTFQGIENSIEILSLSNIRNTVRNTSQ